MAAPYKKLSGSKISFSIVVEEGDIEKAQKGVIAHHKKEISLKGFRKGEAPDDMVLGAIGPQRAFQESFDQVLSQKYSAFVTEHDLHPVAMPQVDIKDLKKPPFQVGISVELFPELSLGNYEKLKPKALKINISEKDIEEALKRLLVAQEREKIVERAAKAGDVVKVDLVGTNEKNERVWGEDENNERRVVLGEKHIMPEVEKAITGMKAGESKEKISVKFPDQPMFGDKAGGKMLFSVKLISVGAVDPSAIDKALATEVLGREATPEELRQEVLKMLESEEKKQQGEKAVAGFKEKLAGIVKVDLPQSWIDREVGGRQEQMKQSPAYRQDPEAFWKQVGKSEDALMKEFRKDSEKTLKIYLGLSEIVKREALELSAGEEQMVQAQLEHRLSHEGDKKTPTQAQKSHALESARIDKYLASLLS